MSDWIAQYAESHRHPVNRLLHTLGIPLIVVSLAVAAVSPWLQAWTAAAVLFVVGWLLQFIGHALEGKPPEFFKDWRFLFVGVRWWLAKVRGRA
ncbi:MAG: Mpo1-like protein [Vicinamibacterales bacterium]